MGKMQITIQVAELDGGGFVIGDAFYEGEQLDFQPVQAVSSIDEVCGAIHNKLRQWHTECKRLRQATIEDQNAGKVVAPRLWWRNA